MLKSHKIKKKKVKNLLHLNLTAILASWYIINQQYIGLPMQEEIFQKIQKAVIELDEFSFSLLNWKSPYSGYLKSRQATWSRRLLSAGTDKDSGMVKEVVENLIPAGKVTSQVKKVIGGLLWR